MQEEKVTDLVCWAPFSFALLRSCYSANSFFSFCSVCVCLFLWFLLCFFVCVLLPCFCVGSPCFSLGLAPPPVLGHSLSLLPVPPLCFLLPSSVFVLCVSSPFFFFLPLSVFCSWSSLFPQSSASPVFFFLSSVLLFFFSSSLPLREVAFAQLL